MGKSVFDRESEIKSVGIIGGGHLGAKLALSCLRADLEVRMMDKSPPAIRRSLSFLLDNNIDSDKLLENFLCGVTLSGLLSCDIVIEALNEDHKVKAGYLDQILSKPNKVKIYAITSATLAIGEIAGKNILSGHIFGLHFSEISKGENFLEIVQTPHSNPLYLKIAEKFFRKLGNKTITVEDVSGFYIPRLLGFFFQEALILVEEGNSPALIDRCLEESGFTKGPFKIMDEQELSTVDYALNRLSGFYSERLTVQPPLRKAIDSGCRGVPNRQGFYLYNQSGENIGVNQKFWPRNPGRNRRSFEDPTQRCVLVLVNEAIKCLDDGVIESPRDGDYGSVRGLGFPDQFKGPFRFVDIKGPQNIVDKLMVWEKKYGNRFKPAETLIKYAKTGHLFFSKES